MRNTIVWVLLIACASMVGCGERPKTYSQETPDDVLKSAVLMVKNRETEKLGTLIWSEGPEMKVMLSRLGVLLGNMQKLSVAATEKFPAEFAAMRAEADKAAASGKPNSLLSGLMNAGRGKSVQGPDPAQARDLVNQLFADPYGWLERNSTRLTTIKPTDDAAFILLDGQPAIPVIGLGMKLENGKWYVQLPSNVPPITSFWPRSKAQWSILTSTVKVLNNAVEEMTEDVKTGRVTTLKTLGDRAGDKLIFPGGIAFVAYGKELDVRNRVDRQMSRFNKRLNDWKKERASEAGGDGGEKSISVALLDAIGSIASGEVEAGVRSRKAPNFETMTTGDFERVVWEWVGRAGLKVDATGDLAGAGVDAAVKAWEVEWGKTKAKARR